MGEVFRARDIRLNRTVAIKISRERFIGRLKGEARTADTLNHPNVVQIYELASYDSLDFIVMEYVPGKTLAELLQAAPLSLDQALGYANQIASALAAAHCAGIVNRDIKPANILCERRGRDRDPRLWARQDRARCQRECDLRMPDRLRDRFWHRHIHVA